MMKRVFCILLLILFPLTACQTEKSEPIDNSKPSLVEESEDHAVDDQTGTINAFVHRENAYLVQAGEKILLQAVNFDNLTWYQDTDIDGMPVYLLHHKEEDFDVVQSLGFNSIRYFLRWQDLFKDPVTCEKNEEGWEWLGQNIAWAKERGMFLILDFHCPYGGFGTDDTGTWPIWSDESVQDSFLFMWQEVARTFKDETSIAGYDLMNEPSLPVDGEKVYAELLESVIAGIREEDPNHLLIVEAAVGIEGVEASYRKPNWVQVPDSNVMYSFHFYEPLSFTHNGSAMSESDVRYPDETCSKEDVRTAFMRCFEELFLQDYPLFLGEFGCNDWSSDSGSAVWIEDVYRLCEERNMHTAFFAYRGFENIDEKDGFGFTISSVYLQAKTDSGTEICENWDIIHVLKECLNK